MAEWRQFQLKQRQKRLAKCEKKGKGELKKTQEEIVVQTMSSEVSGKQQKYTRIGPREFVPFEYDEMSFKILWNLVKSTLRDRLKKIWYATFSLVSVAHLAKR